MVKDLNIEKKYKNNIGFGILIVFIFVLGIFVGRKVDSGSVSNILGTTNTINLDRFWQVWNIASKNYVDTDKVTEDDMVYGAIKGMINSFDDVATVYLDPEETKEFNEASEGKYFEGIGAELGYEDGAIVVVTPLEGSPAKDAGIRSGDYILKVDGYEFTSKDSVYDAVAKIRGEAGTEVTLTVVHKNESDAVDIKIVRQEITVSSMSVEYVGKDKEIALFEVNRFTEATLMEWESEWNSKVSEIVNSGVKKVILDLRGNPGGFFDAAIYAGDDFLNDGYIISQQVDSEGNIEKYESKKGGDLTDVELVVLVNEGSASASEILSGALQLADRAEIIGMPTYGKGTAQRIFDFSDGSSLHLTILKWLLPDGSNIDKENSITPDIEINLTNDDFKAGIDPQLDKAIEFLSI